MPTRQSESTALAASGIAAILESPATMYAGLDLLVAASIWNSWPTRPAASCPQCAPGGNDFIQLSARRNSYEPKTEN